MEEHVLTNKYQHSKKCKDNKRRNVLVWFIDGVPVLKQKRPFDDRREKGHDGIWHFKNIYVLGGYLHQTRWTKDKTRNVKYPISNKVLESLNIPFDIKINFKK